MRRHCCDLAFILQGNDATLQLDDKQLELYAAVIKSSAPQNKVQSVWLTALVLAQGLNGNKPKC